MFKAQPFFILSNPRSGSSLLRVVCDSHQNISVPPECGYIQWWYQKYKDWNQNDNLSPRLDEYCNDLASSRKFETWNFDFKVFQKNVQIYNPENYAQLSGLVPVSFGDKRKEKIEAWGDKNNYYLSHTGLLKELYPEGKFIFLIRDGRDVATSYIELQNLKSNSPYIPKLPFTIKEIAEEWKDNNLKLLSFVGSLKKENRLILRYEDLITNLEKECRLICNFLDIPYDPVMEEYFLINRKLHLEPKETLDWKRKTLKSPDKLKIGKYKKEFSKEEVEEFTSIAGNILREFEYEI